jgi:hypothetical protein
MVRRKRWGKEMGVEREGCPLRHDEKSAERLDSKRVAVSPLCRSVGKRLKIKGIGRKDGNGVEAPRHGRGRQGERAGIRASMHGRE